VLRKDLNNDRKVAYVLDTLFHGGEQESMDDSIIKAHERGQVLFMDIGGGPVLFPKDFPQKIYGDGHRETYDPITFNFELITDSKTLMFLEKNYKNWIDETDNQNWLTPLQLAKHYGVTYIAMEKYLNEMKAKQEMQGCIKDRELLGGRTAPCLHNDEESRQKFQQELDKMKILNEGKGTWLTPFDITQYCGLTEPTIEVRLNEMKTDPRMKEHIQSFRTKYGRVTPHLRNNAESIELFQSILNEQNFLTEKWLSPVQLMQYCGLAAITIENRLNEMQHDPRIQKYIQGKKLLGGRTAQCLQNIPEAIEIFKKLLNEVWLTPTQLMNYCDLKSAPGIEKRLNEMKPDPRMKGLIQDRKIKGGRLVPCLRGDEKSIELFRQILNETWLSSSQLMKYCKMDHRTIENYLINMQEDPRMQGHTCYRTLQKGRVALCLRGDQESIDLFLTILKEQKINDLKHGTVVLTMAIISGGKQKSDAHKR